MDIPRFIDLVDNVDKAGDHLANIAQTIIAALQWAGIEPKAAPGARYDANVANNAERTAKYVRLIIRKK